VLLVLVVLVGGSGGGAAAAPAQCIVIHCEYYLPLLLLLMPIFVQCSVMQVGRSFSSSHYECSSSLCRKQTTTPSDLGSQLSQQQAVRDDTRAV
jgi:hypothetical protein